VFVLFVLCALDNCNTAKTTLFWISLSVMCFQVFDVNMNVTAASPSGGLKQSGDGHLRVPLLNGLSPLQAQVSGFKLKSATLATGTFMETVFSFLCLHAETRDIKKGKF